ncbi:hypothetical protein [Natrarchaeobaculum sulfurireducens]|uniref:hypothetical protein n=1 Tax=Natrarchaeobaculum sulfurireducens TaxID=2044521 RepID=UPI000E3EBB10|nr:hypothetical protein [Natrarchaeobaculum sulfurireducens]
MSKYALLDDENRVVNVIRCEDPESYESSHEMVSTTGNCVSIGDKYDTDSGGFKRQNTEIVFEPDKPVYRDAISNDTVDKIREARDEDDLEKVVDHILDILDVIDIDDDE